MAKHGRNMSSSSN